MLRSFPPTKKRQYRNRSAHTGSRVEYVIRPKKISTLLLGDAALHGRQASLFQAENVLSSLLIPPESKGGQEDIIGRRDDSSSSPSSSSSFGLLPLSLLRKQSRRIMRSFNQKRMGFPAFVSWKAVRWEDFHPVLFRAGIPHRQMSEKGVIVCQTTYASTASSLSRRKAS